jgi:hypothetical protein
MCPTGDESSFGVALEDLYDKPATAQLNRSRSEAHRWASVLAIEPSKN